MGVWRMDRKSAEYIARHIFELPKRFPLEHCPLCDSDYLEFIGHEHDNYIDFQTEDNDDRMLKMIPKIHEDEYEDTIDNMFDFLKGD